MILRATTRYVRIITVTTGTYLRCHVAAQRKFKELRKHDGCLRRLETLGDEIKAKRLDLGLQQQDVAQMLDVSTERVLGWEKNEHQPLIRKFKVIIEFLGFDPTAGTERTTLGACLIQARRVRGLTQRQAADQM